MIPARSPLSPGELEIIRRQIEEGFEVIGAVDDESAASLLGTGLHLLSKLSPAEYE